MASRMMPMSKKLREESRRLFDEYMARKEGPFSHEDMMSYVRKHGSKELLEQYATEDSTELIK